jgi:hypothetical protein
VALSSALGRARLLAFRVASWLVPWLVLGLLTQPAHAWIETEVRQHQAVVSVQQVGSAEVRHTLVLKVRGGPLLSLEIEGVGTAVELLGDATVRPAAQGSSDVWPLETQLREDGTAVLRIATEKGLRAGTYRFEFGYHLDLFERGWLERRGNEARLTWVQPRFSSGIDAARVLFRVPRGAREPRLPDEEGASSGVLLAEVRRGADLDEVELVRAHVARGEPAVWELDVPAALFPRLGSETGAAAPALSASQKAAVRISVLPKTTDWMWALGVLVALFFAALQLAKWRAVLRNCTRAGVEPRPLVPLPAALRIPVGGALAGVATCAALAQWPTAAGVAWSLALLCAVFLPPRRSAKPRGPGEWVPLSSEDLSAPAPPVAGRVLDAGTAPGAACLAVIVLLTAAAAWAVLPSSAYHAGLLALSVTAWLPVYFSGRSTDMPADAAFGSLPVYQWFAKKLGRVGGLSLEYWGRRPLGTVRVPAEPAPGDAPFATASGFDEIRLRIQPERALAGLRVLEIGVEIGAGLVALPCVLVRVDEDSPAHRALPRHVQWVRGRHGEERVAVLRPRVPTRQQCLQLVTFVLGRLGGQAAKAPRKHRAAARVAPLPTV